MDSLGLFRHGGVLFHGVHMDDGDFDIIKKRGICVVTNPASNLKLASGIAPVKRYLDRGSRWRSGRDGPASNNCLDMFREMFLVTGLQKVFCDDPEAVPAMDVLKMAVTNGAHAMGLSDCDSIAPGKTGGPDHAGSVPSPICSRFATASRRTLCTAQASRM